MCIHTCVHADMPTILPTYLPTLQVRTTYTHTHIPTYTRLHTYTHIFTFTIIHTHTHGQIRTYIVYDIYSNPTYTDILQISRFLISVLEANTFLPWIHVNRHTIRHIWHSTSYSSSYLSSQHVHTQIRAKIRANHNELRIVLGDSWQERNPPKIASNYYKLNSGSVNFFILLPIMVRIPPERWHKEVYKAENHFRLVLPPPHPQL